MIEQFVAGLGRYKYLPSKHDVIKARDDEEHHHHGSVIVGVVRNVNGAILSTEIGTSSSSDEHREI